MGSTCGTHASSSRGRNSLPRVHPADGTIGGVEQVAIVGSGGSGKSTLAGAVGVRTGLPVVHLDEHYWRPGWVETPRDAWRARQAELCADDRWIIDGNYGGTIDLRLDRADTLVFLDLPRRVTVPRVLRRWAVNRGRPVQAPGCPERADAAFLRWVWDYPAGGRVRLLDAIHAHRRRDLDVVALRSPRAVRRWLAAVPSPLR
jgi:adenylate kinase family enzyme